MYIFAYFATVLGLYKVEKFWFTIGMSGFGVYKFAMRRLDDQVPPPWNYNEQVYNILVVPEPKVYSMESE